MATPGGDSRLRGTDEDVPDESTAADTHAPDEPTPDAVTTLTTDEVFDLLANQRRSDVLVYLGRHDGTATVSALAEWIAARENDIPVSEVTSAQRKRAYVGLYQTHLPKMADADVIDYEQGDDELTLAPNAALLWEYLDETETDRWYLRYAAVSACGIGLLVFGELSGVTSVGYGVAASLVPVLVLCGVLVVAGVHVASHAGPVLPER